MIARATFLPEIKIRNGKLPGSGVVGLLRGLPETREVSLEDTRVVALDGQPSDIFLGSQNGVDTAVSEAGWEQKGDLMRVTLT